MKRIAFVLTLLSLLIAAGIYAGAHLYYCGPFSLKTIYCDKFDSFPGFYGDKLRGSLFAGFLTLGGFLLSLKTFIIVNMKKEVFDNSEYKKEWEEQKKLDVTNSLGSRYSSLRELSAVLFISIFSCISTAVLQLTVGLAGFFWSTALCLWAVEISLLFLSWSLWLIRCNLVRMFDYLDNQESK